MVPCDACSCLAARRSCGFCSSPQSQSVNLLASSSRLTLSEILSPPLDRVYAVTSIVGMATWPSEGLGCSEINESRGEACGETTDMYATHWL